ncbi:MAG: hypothetical protein ABIS59_01830, partial [Candidatus Saccharibacteria bacterium]
ESDLTYTKPKSLTVLDETYQVSSWKDVLTHVFETLFAKYGEEIPAILKNDEFVGRYIRAKAQASNLISAQPISNTDYVVEGGTSTNYKRMLVMKVSEHLGLNIEDIIVKIAKNTEED